MLIMGLVGCKGCDESPNPKIIASFKIGQQIGQGGDFPYRFIENDTIETCYDGNQNPIEVPVRFSADDQSMDEYEWMVGSDVRIFNTKTLELFFKQPGSYSVKLKVKRKSRDRILTDSSTRTFILQGRELPKLYGKFRGSLSYRPDSLFDIWICTSNLTQSPDNESWLVDTSYKPLFKNGFNNLMIFGLLKKKYSTGFYCGSRNGYLDEMAFFQCPWRAKNLYIKLSESGNNLTIEFQIRKQQLMPNNQSYTTPYVSTFFTSNRVK